MPTRLYELCDKPRGLVLVTGPTGSGKSTTLASLLDRINPTRPEHILTIEDPIEFLHWHQSCIVNQREIGSDATSFADALRAALRQDPDVILVGEMRDLETISTALTAAETGHLVFATLHTQSAPQTIDRIIDVFPAAQQAQVRVQLAGTLQGIVTQNLVPTADGRGRMAALEILIPDDAVRNLIRQAKVEQIYSVMQTSSARGMQTMEQALADLTLRRVITAEVAFSRSSRPDQLRGLLERGGSPTSTPERPSSSGLGWLRRYRRWTSRRRSSSRTSCRGASEARSRDARVESNGGARKRKLEARARRPQDRRVAARGRARRQQRVGEARPAGARAARPRASSSPARSATCPRSRQRSTSSSRENKLPRRGVRLGVATNRIGVRAFDIAGIDDERQLANAIRFRAHEAVSIPIDEAVLDYHIVSETVDDAGGITRRIVLAAAYREAIDRYTAAFREARIELLGIDLEAFALLRAVGPAAASADGEAPRAIVAVSIGHERYDARDLRRHGLRVHARARVGRRQARGRDRARSCRHAR